MEDLTSQLKTEMIADTGLEAIVDIFLSFDNIF